MANLLPVELELATLKLLLQLPDEQSLQLRAGVRHVLLSASGREQARSGVEELLRKATKQLNDAISDEKDRKRQRREEPHSMEASAFPIFIFSRGRSNQKSGTWHRLAECGLPFTVVVEPHEKKQYEVAIAEVLSWANMSASLGTIVAVPESDQGVSYVRNYILEHLAPSSGWFWLMDDDIKGFFQTVKGVNQPMRASDCLGEAARRMRRVPSTCLFSLEYESFAVHYTPRDVKVNNYNAVVVCMNKAKLPKYPPGPNDKTPREIRYRFRVCEDHDFTLQVIHLGGTTMRFKNLSFRTPNPAACTGGLTEYYVMHQKDIRIQNRIFVDTWPTVSVEVLKGIVRPRYTVEINWKVLDPQHHDPVKILSDDGTNLTEDPLTTNLGDANKEAWVEWEEAHKEPVRPKAVAHASPGSATPSAAETAKQVKAQEQAKPKGWKGWELVAYRDLPLDAEEAAGLERVPHPKKGDSVAIVPVDLSIADALIAGTLIGISHTADETRYQVAPSARGVPLQTATVCYKVPEDFAVICQRVNSIIMGVEAADEDLPPPPPEPPVAQPTTTDDMYEPTPEVLVSEHNPPAAASSPRAKLLDDEEQILVGGSSDAPHSTN